MNYHFCICWPETAINKLFCIKAYSCYFKSLKHFPPAAYLQKQQLFDERNRNSALRNRNSSIKFIIYNLITGILPIWIYTLRGYSYVFRVSKFVILTFFFDNFRILLIALALCYLHLSYWPKNICGLLM